MRMFFALWPDADTRACIAGAAAALRLSGGARPVPRENYHVTLAFVGDVAESRLAVLQQVGFAQRAIACRIEFDACQYWPDPRVVVAAARQTPAALLELWAGLHAELARHGPALNSRCPQSAPPPPLRAHVTLARKVAQIPVLQAMSPFRWSARTFSLVRSDTSGAHSVYTVVDTWPLLYESPIA